MRGFAHSMVITVLAAGVLRPAPMPAQGRDPAAVLAEAREALGGEKRLSAVQNFVATGRTRQVRGDNLVPIEFEISVELPDKYVRKDEIPAQESGPTSTGFNGSDLIQLPVPAAPAPPPGMGRAAGPTAAPSQAQLDAARTARVAAVKQDFVRLTLGMFAASFSSYPLTFSYIGQAEAPQGKADVIEAKAPPNFSVRLFVNSQTHLPIMVSWQAPMRPAGGPGRGGPGAPPGPGEGRGAAGRPEGTAPAAPPAAAPPTAAGVALGSAAAPAQGGAPGPPAGSPPGGPPNAGRSGPPPAPVEFRIYYADYRDVDGLQWPFRLRRATGADTTEETTFDRFRINTKIDPKKFEVHK
jgi:hypothetical protein